MRPYYKEIAGIENGRDITRGYILGMGQYIPTQDSLLNLKSGGDLDLYEQVAQDDRVKSCLQQRFAGLTSKEIIVLPGGDKRIDKQAAEHIKMQLDALNWDNTTEKMQWGVFYGYSVAEMLWGKADDKVIIQGVRVRNRRRFRFGIDQLPRLLSFDNPLGETLPERKFWHFCVGADHDDEPYGRGLAHWLYWLTWFKRNDLKWWITFLENFADPSTVGTYPAGSTTAEKATLEGAVRSLGKSKWAIKPEGMLVELVEASRSGTADYEAMYKTINEAISQVILSQNMTTESGSSESQARVHQDVGDTVIESDDALISGSFNVGPVRWLTEWNFPGAAIPIVQRKLEPEEDLKASAERDKIIVDMGFPANPEYIVEKYGEGFKQEETEAAQSPLNSAQLTAFVSLITAAQQGGWSADMVRTSLQISFPNVPDALLDKMANSMKAAAPGAAPGVDPNNPQAPALSPQTPEQAVKSLDDVAAQFADADDFEGTFEFKMKEGTTKEKNGVMYVLTNSRWKRAEPKSKGKGRTKLSDKSKTGIADVKSKNGVKSNKSLSKVSTGEMGSKPKSDPSGLVLVPKGPQKETKKEDSTVKKTVQQQINDKYSSENPTDKDAKSWLKETIEARNNPTPENVEARTAQYLARQSQRYETGVDADKFSSKVVDRHSYALATHASEQWEARKNPDLVKARTSEDTWFRSRMARADSLKTSDIPKLEKKIAATKSESVKKTAIKQLASLKEDVRREPEVRERSRQDAAKWAAIYSSSKADRVKQLEKEFDAESSKTKTEMEAKYADIKKGKKSAVEAAEDDAANIGGVNRYPSNKPGVYRPISTEDIKDRLRELGASKSEELFSIGEKTTKSDVRQQYRLLAGIHHPDKGGDPSKFRSLNDAYNKIMEKLS